ncbi:hypothetical protein FRB96_000194 [Tulasnella sp. 330]|nr:hypothetical protein FRB96_000194 [Tulasnella sp. 330]KAG8886465.1 hypothetical protein FRB97_002976 [Tulasnella sp. 331]
MYGAYRNAIVVGGSYVGCGVAQKLAAVLPATHRVLLIEPHSHFHHLFAFPRFAVVPKHEHKAFIPYSGLFAKVPAPHPNAVVRAKVLDVQPSYVKLDRSWEGMTELPFEYLIFATGTKLPSPGTMTSDEKVDGVAYFKTYQEGVKKVQSICVVGGGAVGVQMATDIKEYFPDKDVTLIHSRAHTMPKFDPRFHDIIKARCDELGIKMMLSNRVVGIPPNGFPNDGSEFTISLSDGSSITTQLAILATGQIPNNQMLTSLNTSDSIINGDNGFIRVRPTLQFVPEQYSQLFALGDIADSGMPKAARPGAAQADVVVQNVLDLIGGREPSGKIQVGPAGIHLTLGIKKNVVFRDPETPGGAVTIIHREE